MCTFGVFFRIPRDSKVNEIGFERLRHQAQFVFPVRAPAATVCHERLKIRFKYYSIITDQSKSILPLSHIFHNVSRRVLWFLFIFLSLSTAVNWNTLLVYHQLLCIFWNNKMVKEANQFTPPMVKAIGLSTILVTLSMYHLC